MIEVTIVWRILSFAFSGKAINYVDVIGFCIRRLGVIVPMLLGVSVMVFLLMNLAPGNFLSQLKALPDFPASRILEMEKAFGLNEPWYVQYFYWLRRVVCFDFGYSWTYQVPVAQLLWQRVPATVTLAFLALLMACGLAVPLGVLAAIYRGSWLDHTVSILAYAALSLPEFFLALLAIFFAAKTGWFPTGGLTSLVHDFLTPLQKVFDYGHHLVLPTLVLGLGSVASMMRILRSYFLDSMRADFVTTARAKGLSEGTVMFKHVLRNAINPLITTFGFAISGLLSGALIVENVMNYPGLGKLTYEAFLKQDQYVVMAAVLIGCLMLMMGNLLADVLLALVDPRIRLEK